MCLISYNPICEIILMRPRIFMTITGYYDNNLPKFG